MSKTQTIFIVDDERTIREVVRQHPADMILLDIMLPGLDGFTVTPSLY